MKKLLYILVIIMTVTGCVTDAKRTKMRSGLDSINMRNRSDQPFTVEDVKPYVQFFDDHGTPNDRMLAHYLLGRAYYEHHEAPMALQCYQQAIEHADTTATDCDYAQLSRVYGQMADIYYQQNLPHHKDIRGKAVFYSQKSGDTLSALFHYEQEANDYERNGNTDSALLVIDSLINWYDSHGYQQDAAISSGRGFTILVNQGNYSMARKYMQLYEQGSGFFDKNGTILPGREIFYYFKSLLLINENKLDSAEYWLRKELLDGNDFNNKNAASKGLAFLYEKRQMPDSAMKYALYSYAMNDSVYSQMTTNTVEQIHGMYNYTRHQNEAMKRTKEATHERMMKETIFLVLCLFVIFSYMAIRRLVKKRKTEFLKYKEGVAMIARQQAEVTLLRQHEQDYNQLIAEKEQQIEAQKKDIAQYRKTKIGDDTEKRLQESKEYHDLMKLAVKGQVPTNKEWQMIDMLIIDHFPEFNDFMMSKRYLMNMKEYQTCILFRLHLKPQDISHMLSVSPAYISKICSEMMKKIYQEQGNAKQLIEKLNEIS
ncbi:MAG: hypothetical protein IJV17_02285 [Prevotella sp.]|nr:hypothetical protein [Prevotella sp.]MBQ9216256.1 hypothetical protein [Prevotella sp.]